MNEAELKERLQGIRRQYSGFDFILRPTFGDTEGEDGFVITRKQGELVKEVLALFESLSWQVSLNSYKQLVYGQDDGPIDARKCGRPVQVMPAGKEYGGKNYFGVLLGDLPRSIHHEIDSDGNLIATRSFYNPSIFVPELGAIVYGSESWWREIESEEDLDELITAETIKNVWYVKALIGMTGEREA
jgi:hypothetical protein